MVGVLKLSLYGTRDAAANFQKEVLKLMTSIGFRQSGYNASLYHKARRDTRGGGTYGAAATGSEGSSTRSGGAHGAAAIGVGRRREESSTRSGGTYGAAATGAGKGAMQGVSVLVHGDDFVAAGNRNI